MKVVLNTKYRYIDVIDNLLRFEDLKYEGSFILVKECKFVDVRSNQVYFMNVVDGEVTVTNSRLRSSTTPAAINR